jgi:hypothetical protein
MISDRIQGIEYTGPISDRWLCVASRTLAIQMLFTRACDRHTAFGLAWARYPGWRWSAI